MSLERITPATVSHHLKILPDAGLIECQREGSYVRRSRHKRDDGAIPSISGSPDPA
ncbi:MAG: ArsR family transcriptional regulator [Terriglobales bacterium]